MTTILTEGDTYPKKDDVRKQYDSSSYNEHRKIYLDLFKAVIDSDANNIDVVDCLEYGELQDFEKEYMEKLTARGSNADIIKTRAMFANNENNHLQLDSNTKIINFENLYNDTFGNAKQSPAFNASYYDESYVSIHNKIVYLPKDSDFTEELRSCYKIYCQNVNALGNEEKEILKKKNAIYSKVFTGAAERIGVVRTYTFDAVNKTVYPAKMEDTESFRLTRHVLTAVNKSWDVNDEKPEGFEDLCNLSKMAFKDAEYDFACYNISKKKLFRFLDDHPIDDDKRIDTEEARAQLKAISDMESENDAIEQFETYAIKKIAALSDEHPKAEMLCLIFNTWPNSHLRAVKCIIESDIPGESKFALIQQFYQNQCMPLIIALLFYLQGCAPRVKPSSDKFLSNRLTS